VLFHQKSRQFFGQGTGHVLTLGEGNQLILVRLAKHALERLARPLQPTFAQCLPILAAQK
jgi:hypothetical protein